MVEKSRYNVEEREKKKNVAYSYSGIRSIERNVYLGLELSPVVTYGKHGHGLKLGKVGPNVSSFSALLVSFTAARVGFTRRRLVLCLQVTQKYCS